MRSSNRVRSKTRRNKNDTSINGNGTHIKASRRGKIRSNVSIHPRSTQNRIKIGKHNHNIESLHDNLSHTVDLFYIEHINDDPNHESSQKIANKLYNSTIPSNMEIYRSDTSSISQELSANYFKSSIPFSTTSHPPPNHKLSFNPPKPSLSSLSSSIPPLIVPYNHNIHHSSSRNKSPVKLSSSTSHTFKSSHNTHVVPRLLILGGLAAIGTMYYYGPYQNQKLLEWEYDKKMRRDRGEKVDPNETIDDYHDRLIEEEYQRRIAKKNTKNSNGTDGGGGGGGSATGNSSSSSTQDGKSSGTNTQTSTQQSNTTSSSSSSKHDLTPKLQPQYSREHLILQNPNDEKSKEYDIEEQLNWKQFPDDPDFNDKMTWDYINALCERIDTIAPYGANFVSQVNTEEAAAILGLEESASREEIMDKYRNLIRLNHPDAGGSAFIANKINDAKNLLYPAAVSDPNYKQRQARENAENAQNIKMRQEKELFDRLAKIRRRREIIHFRKNYMVLNNNHENRDYNIVEEEASRHVHNIDFGIQQMNQGLWPSVTFGGRKPRIFKSTEDLRRDDEYKHIKQSLKVYQQEEELAQYEYEQEKEYERLHAIRAAHKQELALRQHRSDLYKEETPDFPKRNEDVYWGAYHLTEKFRNWVVDQRKRFTHRQTNFDRDARRRREFTDNGSLADLDPPNRVRPAPGSGFASRNAPKI